MTPEEDWSPVEEEWTEVATPEASGVGGTLLDVGKGALKGVGEFAQGAGKLVNRATGVAGRLMAGYDPKQGLMEAPGIADAIMPGAIEQNLPELVSANSAQDVGKVGAQLAGALASGGGGVLSQGARAAIMAAAQEGKLSPTTAMAAVAAAGTAGLGKLAGKAAEGIRSSASAKAIAEALQKTVGRGVGAKEIIGGAAGAYQAKDQGPLATLGGAYAGAKGSGMLSSLVSTAGGQRLLAKALERLSSLGMLAPAAGAAAQKIPTGGGRTIGSTEYAALDER